MSATSGRFVQVMSPEMSPGHCGVCGNSSHDKGFAWFNMDFEFFGTLYFCADCSHEMASIFGGLPPDLAASLNTRVAAQESEIKILREAVALLENTVDNLIGLGAHRGNLASSLDDVVSDDAPEELQQDTLPFDEPADSGEGPSSVPDEPSSESGPDELPSASSDDELTDLLS